MNILDKIAAHKQTQIKSRKALAPVSALERQPYFGRKTLSLSDNLRNSAAGIITEFKRRSPSHPEINLGAKVADVIPAYEKAGAAGISVLTDEDFFGGKADDLSRARDLAGIPLLRKDFTIDEYQIYEARALGADVILLIAALLDKKQLSQFTKTAKGLGLEVLLEVHDQAELEQSLIPGVDMIGVNNRNLKTFDVDLAVSEELAAKIPPEFVKVSESGISKPESVIRLQESGFQGFLIGGNFMTGESPGRAAADFISEVQKKSRQ